MTRPRRELVSISDTRRITTSCLAVCEAAFFVAQIPVLGNPTNTGDYG